MNWHFLDNRTSVRLLALVGWFAVIGAFFGWSDGHTLLGGIAMLAAGGIATIAALRALEFSLLRRRQRRATSKVCAEQSIALPVGEAASSDLVEQMLRCGRYALLLRPQIADQLLPEQFGHALETLQTDMALVPAGEVLVKDFDQVRDEYQERGRPANIDDAVVGVDQYFLDRHAVTNEQFQRFVAAGGYQPSALWPEELLPALPEFLDVSGMPGPRFWQHGRYAEGEARHPVVGICWFEAMAYARWAGKRLPTDAEWLKAASWPVTLSKSNRMQRKFPWGESADRTRANIWGSGPERTVAVDQFAGGVSVGGLHQMIGNVWEWTASEFQLPGSGLFNAASVPLKSLRGGAFDTYFENQASCDFVSGDHPLTRRNNIGFRCAVGAWDLRLQPVTQTSPAASTAPVVAAKPSSPSVPLALPVPISLKTPEFAATADVGRLQECLS